MSQIWQQKTLWHIQGQRSHNNLAHLHPQPMALPSIIFLYLTFYEIYLKVNVTTARSKVKSKSHHDNAHLHPPLQTNVPTKYQLPVPYSFQDITQTRFKNQTLWFLRYSLDKIFSPVPSRPNTWPAKRCG